MSLTLYVDAERWRAHLAGVRDRTPGLVPVAKGNGYGFGVARLAGEAARLGVDTLAVGVPAEVAAARAGGFTGDLLVLAPPRPAAARAAEGLDDARLLRTAASPADLHALAGGPHRVVLEVHSSVHRHGLAPDQLAAAAALVPDGRLAGFALHLPLQPPAGGRVGEARAWLDRLRAAGLDPATIWVSHLDAAELAGVRRAEPQVSWRPRVGTGLWLGDPGALRARATVLDAHRLPRGTPVGYRQRPMPYAGTLLVLAGGTAHGIGLEAPRVVRGPVRRAKVAAAGLLGAAGWALSPYTVAGRKRWFAEPPHMQASLVLLPGSVPAPEVGSEVPVEVRHTTVTFDRLAGL